MGQNNSTWVYCCSLTLNNISYDAFIVNTCIYGLVGHEDVPGVIVSDGGINIRYNCCFVCISVVYSLTPNYCHVSPNFRLMPTHPVMICFT